MSYFTSCCAFSVIAAGLALLSPVAEAQANPSPREVSSGETRMCPMFDPPTWDNMGFKVACERQKPVMQEARRACKLFPESQAWDQQGFTVTCPDAPRPQTLPTKMCPMFVPQTWDNMGFRIPC